MTSRTNLSPAHLALTCTGAVGVALVILGGLVYFALKKPTLLPWVDHSNQSLHVSFLFSVHLQSMFVLFPPGSVNRQTPLHLNHLWWVTGSSGFLFFSVCVLICDNLFLCLCRHQRMWKKWSPMLATFNAWTRSTTNFEDAFTRKPCTLTKVTHLNALLGFLENLMAVKLRRGEVIQRGRDEDKIKGGFDINPALENCTDTHGTGDVQNGTLHLCSGHRLPTNTTNSMSHQSGRRM